jgi:hypothetical protein
MSIAYRRSTFFLALALTIFWPALGQAKSALTKSITIDDSGSEALAPSVSMRWNSAVPSRSAAGNVMVGTTTVRVRLNVMPWLKHSGRIYLNLPAQQPGPIGLSWVTQGRLLPGQLQSGNRVLVYAGRITSPFMEETMTFRFTVDGARMRRPVPVSYHFEIDED